MSDNSNEIISIDIDNTSSGSEYILGNNNQKYNNILKNKNHFAVENRVLFGGADEKNKDDNKEKKLKDKMKKYHTYPSPSEEDFIKKIYEKREFYYHKKPYRNIITNYEEIREYRDEYCARDFKIGSHQAFLSNFINPDTPYRGILIFHGTGTGKTCAAITIAEKFKKNVEKYGNKIHVLVSGPLNKEQFKDEVLQCTGETYLKYTDTSMHLDEAEKTKIKKNAINLVLQYYRFMSYRSFYKKVLGEKIIEKSVEGNKVKVLYRKTEEGDFERDVAVDRIYNLNNTLLIIDEAHNITGNEYGEAVKKIIQNSYNLKIVLLTATPMKNLADDIVELINYLRPIDNLLQREKIFNSHKNFMMDFKEGGIDYLKKMTRGYISYLRGSDPLTFAERIDKGKVPKGLIFTKVTRCEMLPFQLKSYKDASRDKGDTLDRKSEAVANFVFPGLSQDKKELVGYYGREGINIIKNQLKSYQDALNKKIYNDIFMNKNVVKNDKTITASDTQNDFIYLSEMNKTITGSLMKFNNLKYFSIKFYTALKKLSKLVIGKKGPGTAFIYSNLVKVGIDAFQEILIQNGYLEYQEHYSNYNIKNDTVCYYCGQTYDKHKNLNKNKSFEDSVGNKEQHDFHPAAFITITGKSDEHLDLIPEDKHKILKSVFNSIDNKDGKNIKFVLGSKVMNEGITLENVREVHILDVYFNLGRVDQVIGRAIRFCKHYHITNESNPFPKVSVYKYVVSLPKEEHELSTEEELYKKAELKYLLIKKAERALKETSIDCPINRHGNMFPEEIERYKNCGTAENPCPAVCDYMNCEYKCDDEKLNAKYYDPGRKIYKSISKDKLDYSTFTSALARDEINYAKKLIKEMYKLNNVYNIEKILSYVKKSYPVDKRELFDSFFVFKALDELIPIYENDFNNFKDTILDRYNKPGYLIYRKTYYIFQPFDQNEDVPMYYRTKYDKDLLPKITLHEYMKNQETYKKYKKYNKDENEETQESNNENDKGKGKTSAYDFESIMEKYYDRRDEFEYVGVIDKHVGRKRAKHNNEISDVFKIRNKRAKFLDKRRGTNIPSLKGAVCNTSKNREFLIKIAKKIGIETNKFDMETRIDICNIIKERLLFLEKYSTKADKNKLTYIMIPRNHPIYAFPYNLEDRVEWIINNIKKKIKISNLNITTEKDYIKKTADKKPDINVDKIKLPKYIIKIKSIPELKKFENILINNGALLKGTNYEIIVE
jgi:hypothetical protein